MIKYHKGNLLDSPDSYIAHGCNAQGVMGSGVAKAIRDKWPEAYDVYKFHQKHFGLRLGTVSKAIIDRIEPRENKCIINCITQEFYGRDGKQYASYQAIERCMNYLGMMTIIGRSPSLKSVSIPKIGCGLGGADWEVVEKILLNVCDKYPDVQFNVWEI